MKKFIPIIVCLILNQGCGQDNKQVQDQPSQQDQVARLNQEAAAQGNTHVNLYNGPVPGGGSQQVFIPGPDGTLIAANIQSNGTAAPNGTTTAGQNATYSMVAYVNTVSGGTSATPTGTNTGGSMTQTPTQTGTQTPTQTVTPETSASVPIGVAMPGGNVSNQANAATRGTATATKQDQIDQMYQEIRAQQEFIRELLKQLATKPTTQPDTLPMTPVN